MPRLPGWGLLLAIGMPLLVLLAWNRLGGETSRIQLDRYADWSSGHVTPQLLYPMQQHFRKNRTLAGPDSFALPPVPAKSGVKAWSLQPDAVLRVELEAKEGGKPVVLRYVPVVKSANGPFYDCVSDLPRALVGRFCRSEWLQSEAEIPAQLEANARVLESAPAVATSSGATVRAAGAIGSVIAVPARTSDLDRCGSQCLKLQRCVTPRPLACSRTVPEGNTRRQEVAATRDDFRGSSFATRDDADRACVESHGDGWHVVTAGSIPGAARLTSGNEYWAHDELRAENNCWR